MAQPPAIPIQSASEAKTVFAMAVGALFLAVLALIIIRNRWNRPDLDKDHAAIILSQLNTFGGTGTGAVVVRKMAAIYDPDVLADIRGLFHGEPPDDPTATSATREVFGEILREIREELNARSPSVSKVPTRAIQEAILTLILGSIAVVPVAVWREATKTSAGTVPTLGEVASGVQLVWTTLVTVFTSFPYLDTLFALGLSFGIIGAEFIWTTWMLPPLILATLAGTYLYLERRLDVDRDVSGPRIRGWIHRTAILSVMVWAIGTTLAAVASVQPFGIVAGVALAALTLALHVYLTRDPADHREDADTTRDGDGEDTDTESADPIGYPFGPDDDGEEPEHRYRDHFRGVNWKHSALFAILALGIGHELAALFAAAAVAVAVTQHWTRETLNRWRSAAQLHGRDALALDIVHSLTIAAATLTLPLLIGYAGVAFGTGKALEVASVVLSAPSTTVTAVGILLVMMALTLAVYFLDRFRDVRRAVKRSLSVQSVRTVVFAKAFPSLLSVAIAVMLLAVGINPVAAIAGALAVGLIARFAYMAFNLISLKTQQRTGRDSKAARVVINGRKVTDADGEPVYVASVNGHRIAHRDVDRLIKQIRRDTRSLLRDGRPETASFARYYYKEGVTRGKVNLETVSDELTGDIRTRLEANIKQTDADAEQIMDKLRAEYPSEWVDKVVNMLKSRGRVTRRDNEFEWSG